MGALDSLVCGRARGFAGSEGTSRDVAQDEVALLAIADGLYALVPEEFTEARDGQVDKARREGQPDAARLIKTWRRPRTSAWLVNMLARERADQLSQLYDLDAALRGAQQRGAGEQFRALSPQRRRIVDELVFEARTLADNAGHRINENVVREVEATLQAALADPRAADAVRTGRLLIALSSNGFDPVNLDGAVVLWTEPEPSGPTHSHPSVRADAERVADRTDGGQPRLDAARAAVRDAAAGSAQAEQKLSATEQALRAAEEPVDELRSRVTELKEALVQARGAADDADRELRAARSARDAAEHDVRVAHRRMAAAESKLERLEP